MRFCRETAVPLALVIACIFTLSTAVRSAGAPTLTVYFTQGFDDQAWQTEAYEKVAKAWKPAGAPVKGAKCVLIAIVAKDGEISGLRSNLSSGAKAWDDSAVEAMKAASPFPALPKSWRHATLEVHWHFENRE